MSMPIMCWLLTDNHAFVSSLQTAGLLAERLRAWKHAVAYLEDYVGAMEKIHGKHAKEYERALKVSPARHGKETVRSWENRTDA